jgi:glycosyltransferase involved in cell wall biosynthesis
VLLLTSVGEALPNVVIEALYLYKPIISTDVGDIRQVIGECGEVSEANSRQISAKLSHVFENYQDYENELSSYEFTFSLDRFKIENVVANYQSIWREL